MNFQRPICWYEGQLLQPQHFQLNDLYAQSLLTPLYKLSIPHFWGVNKLDIDIDADLNKLKPNKIEFLFKDMSYVIYPGNAIIEAESCKLSNLTKGGKPETIYAGIKKIINHGENVTEIEDINNISNISTRYISTFSKEEVVDLYEGKGASASIKQMYYVIKFFSEKQFSKIIDYEVIPIIEIEKKGDKIKKSNTFIPPVINISSSEVLSNLISEITNMINSRIHKLEPHKRNRSSYSGRPESTRFIFALRSLCRYGPFLSHLNLEGNIHPWNIYGILKQLSGELTSFSDNINLNEKDTPLLLNYNHNKLWECFSKAKEEIARLMDSITAGPKEEIDLKFKKRYFSASLPDHIFNSSNHFYLVITTQVEHKIIKETIKDHSILSSIDLIDKKIDTYQDGIGIKYIENNLQQLPDDLPINNSLYYKIDHTNKIWNNVEEVKGIAFYMLANFDQVNVQLMVAGG